MDKKKLAFYFSLIACLLLLFACADKTSTVVPEQKQPEPPAKTGDIGVQVPPVRPDIQDTPIAPSPVEEKLSNSLSKEVKELLEKADSKVKSFSFIYSPPPDNKPRDTYYVKGDKMKMKGFRMNVVKNVDYFDTVYFDAASGIARGYCESREVRCLNGKQNFPLPFDDYVIKTPYQWTKGITKGQVVGSEMLYQRQTKKVEFGEDGAKYTLWIDMDYGLTVRAQIEKDGKKERYDYSDLAINGVSDTEMVPPKK